MQKIKAFFKKYGIHILVEVFIIVAGVLIAFQVNNWSEKRKEIKRKKGILKMVINDWENDTLFINQYIDFYKPYIKTYNDVINGNITDEYLDTCAYCPGLISRYSPYKAESNGIELLKKQVDLSTNFIQQDTFIISLINTQKNFDNTINQMANRIKEDIDRNVLDLTEQDWFVEVFKKRKVTTKFKTYFKSKEFKNRVARHQIFVEYNIMPTLKAYKNYIINNITELKRKYNQL